MVWWPKTLTYGNWGGPGWSGGRFESDRAKVAWEVEPVDAMDAAFKLHDYAYQCGANRAQSDIALVRSLAGTDVKGVWPNIYRVGAMAIFGLKGVLGRLLLAVLFASALAAGLALEGRDERPATEQRGVGRAWDDLPGYPEEYTCR